MPDEDEPEAALPARATSLARRAERLLNALAGVLHASVSARDDGRIAEVHITAAPGLDPRRTQRNVQSALLAGLAIAVDVDRIHVATDETAQRANGNGPGTRNGAASPNGSGAGANEHDDDDTDVVQQPRLVAVELEPRPGERLACQVVVAAKQEVHRASVETPDLPGAAEHAAAEAAVRALRGAGFDVALDGVRSIEIAGHTYVVVALRGNSEDGPRRRAAAAEVTRSGVHAAANAALDAARRLA